MSKSGCTTVLVDGPMTPNFARQPRTSRMLMAPGAAAVAQTFGFSTLAAPTIGREPASAKVSAHDARWGNKPMSRDDLTIYRAQGFGGTVGLGARPGLCIVDFVNGFVDPEIFGGGNIAAAVANTVGLLAAARARR